MFGKRSKSHNGYFWNSFAGVVNAGEAVVLSMVVTRTEGLAEAGVLSIAFAVGNLMMTIGKFGVRNYQATDVEEKFTFSDYFWARIITVGIMIVLCILDLVYCGWIRNYSRQKVIIIASICFIYAIDSIEDVFWGFYQQRQALDIGAKIFIFRWIIVLIVIGLFLVWGQGLQRAVVVGSILNAAVSFILSYAAFSEFHERISHMKLENIIMLLEQCFPLAAVAFMMFYVTNAPKYAIDRYLSEEIQACYGFIAMPVFTIELLNRFIYQPSLVELTLKWKKGRMQNFCNTVRKQNIILFEIMSMCLIGAYICGIPVLSVLYSTDLNLYKAELLVLLLGGGMMAYVGYFCVLLTIMRKQYLIMYGYTAITVITLLFTNLIVKYHGIMGVAIFFDFLMTVLTFFFYFIYQKEVKKIEYIN